MEKRIQKGIIRVAVTGPESTGKSSLAESLAMHFNSVWVPEFAREYLNNIHRDYDQNDILEIAKGQIDSENKNLSLAKRILFSDTELIVTKIWSDVKYGECDNWILENIERQKYDLYLLCNIDLPWEFDILREHPEQREYLMKLYENELIARKYNFAVISGTGQQRINNAISFVEKLL